MARITVEDCLKNIPNKFELVLLAAERARQLIKGARPLVESDNREVVLALREIDRGLAPLMSWWALFVASTASSKWLGTFLRQSSTVIRAIGFRLSVYRSRQKLILDVRTYVNSDKGFHPQWTDVSIFW